VLITDKYFDMDDDGYGQVVVDEVDPADSADIAEAIRSCPEGAIELND
jgi:ferredoxin